jgi:hypothetical protein
MTTALRTRIRATIDWGRCIYRLLARRINAETISQTTITPTTKNTALHIAAVPALQSARA